MQVLQAARKNWDVLEWFYTCRREGRWRSIYFFTSIRTMILVTKLSMLMSIRRSKAVFIISNVLLLSRFCVFLYDNMLWLGFPIRNIIYSRKLPWYLYTKRACHYIMEFQLQVLQSFLNFSKNSMYNSCMHQAVCGVWDWSPERNMKTKNEALC